MSSNTKEQLSQMQKEAELDIAIAEMQGTIAKAFMGLPVRVDPELKGNEHYINISEEMFMELEKTKYAEEVRG